MAGSPKSNAKRKIIQVLKLIVVFAAWIFVINKIANAQESESFSAYFSNINTNQVLFLFIICILMLLNWSLETVKWQLIIRVLEKISFIKAFKAVWAGIVAGTVTPNRIGEFGGRIVFLKSEIRKKAISMTLFGDLAQFIITLSLGFVGFIFISYENLFNLSEINDLKILIIISSIILTIVGFAVFFYIEKIFNFFSNNKKTASLLSSFIPEYKIDNKLKLKTLLFSLTRYIIFNLQFFIALQFFEVEISLFNSLIATSAMYLAIHIIPNIPFAEIGIRLSFSIIFIGLFTDDTIAISLASLLIYIINIAIPALFGGVFLMKEKSV